MVESTLDDLDILYPGASLLSKVHLAAEARNLHHLLDAYEAFCLSSSNWLAWRSLSNLMELAMQSAHLMPEPKEPNLALQPEDPYKLFLSELSSQDLSYHISDVVVAFLHCTGVFQSQHHIEGNKRSIGLEVADWTTKGPENEQAVVRTHLLQLSRAFLRVLFEGIIDEIMARTNDWPRLTATLGSHTPCEGSLISILLFLDIEIDPALIRIIAQKTGRLMVPPAQRWGFQSRPTSFFKRLRNPPRPVYTLESIKEFQQSDILKVDDGYPTPFMDHDSNDQRKRSSKRSSFSDFRSFVTAFTHGTASSSRGSFDRRSAITTATTNRSSIQTFLSWPSDDIRSGIEQENEWSLKLRLRDIVSDPELEDWSGGRGQHAQFSSEERDLIPLIPERPIARTSTAVVDSVICRRVRLVRKVIELRKSKKLRETMQEEVMREVQQLYNAQHAHIVRLVGSYMIENQLAILTYPRAEWNLEQFLSSVPASFSAEERRVTLQRFFGCLAKVLDFIHSFPIKHKDIKPQNILVRDMRACSVNNAHSFQVYLADFGSSKIYSSVDDTQTEGYTTFTRLYAAQEVLERDSRDLSADIFSLGCVFAEMLASAVDYSENLALRSALFEVRDGGDGACMPYCYVVEEICSWLNSLDIHESNATSRAVRSWIPSMLSDDPVSRPSAHAIAEDPCLTQVCSACDRATPEAFQRAPGL
ncbi:hypothetical protein OPT61_g6356 [Boeremia exigua]|uniref:Uncharacterized protein n=1 Tax=Boeremia exigua TaxID=749465 RepID=A0ACC2I6X1_9PLEO|nr:hypothetical protein OPT61_g6356 [Boeremia exigua]